MVDTGQLQDQPFLTDLAEDELAVLSGIIQKKRFQLGETVFRASQEGQSLFMIRSGEAKACMAAPDGELFTLRILKEGDIFGAMSFINGTQRSATIIAVSELAAFLIDRSDFEQLADESPEIGIKLMRKIVLSAQAIVREMNARYIEMITYMWGRKRFT